MEIISAFPNLVQHRHIIYVLHADKDGELLTKLPNGEYSDSVDWLLIDSLQGGSGKKNLIGRIFEFQLMPANIDGY
jgi:hypothetical protein